MQMPRVKLGACHTQQPRQFPPMKSLLRPIVALLATLTISFAAVPDDVRQDLGKLVPEAIRLIEAKEFATLLETLVPPDEFKQIIADHPIAEFAAKFGEKKAGVLLAVLKATKDLKAKFSEDGNTATFDLPDNPEFPKKTLVFAKIDGRWFIKN